jgi:hypothetical protein
MPWYLYPFWVRITLNGQVLSEIIIDMAFNKQDLNPYFFACSQILIHSSSGNSAYWTMVPMASRGWM